MADTAPKRLGRYLTKSWLNRFAIPADVQSLPLIVAAWAECAGEPLAAQVQPIRWFDQRLILRARSPVWASKVRHQQHALIARLRRHSMFRQLIALEVRVAPRTPGSAEDRPSPPRRLSRQTRQLLKAVANDLRDPRLSAALARLSRSRDPGTD